MGSKDLISSLSDELLGKILSLLCTKEAASTSVLSKRWRNLLAFVDKLDLRDASGNHRFFCDFVDRSLALLRNSTTVKRFSLDCDFRHDESRIDSWIRTVLERGFLELSLKTEDMHCIDMNKLFTSNKLVKLTIFDGFFPDGRGRLPRGPGGVLFPNLKTLTLVQVAFSRPEMYMDFISGCPVLEELFILNDDDNNHPTWPGVVSSPSIQRLTIHHIWPNHRVHVREDSHHGRWFETPSLVYLDYTSYVSKQYHVDFDSLEEARLDIRSWGPLRNEYDGSEIEGLFGDVTYLVHGIRTVTTLHLSSNSLEVFHLCCDTIPVFNNLLTLSFESDKEKGWQVVPLLLTNSPNLQTLVIKDLVHQVTDRCGDFCACIPTRNTKRKKTEEGVCCLSTCQVKVLNILGYRGTCGELEQMKHFLGNLKFLETVKIGVEVNHLEDNHVSDSYLRITDALMNLPRVSSNCHIHFF